MPANHPPATFRGADLLLLAPLAGLCFHLLSYLKLSARLIAYPFGIESNEGVVLQLAYDLARLRPIYRSLADFPFVPGDYPPLFLLVNAAAIKAFGLNLWSGRLLSCLALLSASVVLFLWIRRETRWTIWALCLALCPFLSPLFFSRTALYRVDVLAAALSFAGVFLLSVSRDERGDLYAAVCLVLALYAKHSMVAAPLACFVYLLTVDRDRALRFIGWLLGIGGTAFLLCTVATRREFFRHLVLYHAMGTNLGAFLPYCRQFLQWTAPFALCWAVFVATGVFRREGCRLAAIYALACGLHFVFLTRRGASLHYLLEPSLSCFLATGLLLPRLGERPKGRATALVSLCLVSLIAAQLFVLRAAARPGEEVFASRGTLQSLEAGRERDVSILEEIRRRPGEILAQDQSYPLLAGRDSLVSPFHIAQLSREGRFDQSKLLKALRTGRFSLVILHSPAGEPFGLTRDCFTDEVLAAIARHYRQVPGRFPGRWLYEPK